MVNLVAYPTNPKLADDDDERKNTREWEMLLYEGRTSISPGSELHTHAHAHIYTCPHTFQLKNLEEGTGSGAAGHPL